MKPSPPLLASACLLVSLASDMTALAAPPALAPLGSALPAPPQLDDPMLARVAAPARVLGSWDEAISLLNARSLDLRNAYDSVKAAEAQWRIALAQMLPSISAGATLGHLQYLERPSASGGSGAGGVVSGSQFVTSSSTSFSTQVGLQQEVVNVQDVHAIGTARAAAEAARLSAEDLHRTLALSAANAIVAVLAAERVAEVNRVGLRNALPSSSSSPRRRRRTASRRRSTSSARKGTSTRRARRWSRVTSP